MRLRVVTGILYLAGLISANAASESNIVIKEYHNDFYVEVARDGVTPERIKNKQSVTYEATRTPGTAILHTYYDDFITVDKAKAKGGKPIYAKARSAGVFFDDSRACYLPVPLEKVNTEATASIELTYTKPEFCDFVYLFDLYPVESYYFSLHLPLSLKDRFDVVLSNAPADCQTEKTVSPDGKEYIISVTAKNCPEIYREEDTPSVRHFAPYITILGCFNDVNELYDRFSSYVNREDPDAEKVKAKAVALTMGCADDMAKIDSIQKWVRENIRYVAIENGDLGHSPDLPSNVLDK
ncbi:MAG: hypothetical protein K2J06_05035, partial [Muribaculaceae bacterium]|nr:hypothetical protein [Muribaculaceae bacterium]